MAIKLIANYSKRLGLPGYSSHQFSVSIETEVLNPDDVGKQSERLYQLLQSNVDEQIQSTGFVPPLDYGMDGPNTQPPSNGHHGSNGNGPLNGRWKCSDKQKDLILKLVEEHQLDKADVEALAVERFGKGVRLLNKVEASGLIDELLDTHGGNPPSGDRGTNRRDGSAYRSSNGRSAA
jgi:hypothetical protein